MGVPQGSIHGPVFFIVKAMGYVDDHKSKVFKSLSIYSKLEKNTIYGGVTDLIIVNQKE